MNKNSHSQVATSVQRENKTINQIEFTKKNRFDNHIS